MFSLNKITLIGNLGQDAEHRFTTNNISITSFSIATTYGYKNKDGKWENETTWHNVTAFDLSDFLKDSLKKGRKFYIEGRLKKEEYTDKEGIKRFAVKIIADKFSGIIPLDSQQNTESRSQTYDEVGNPSDANDDLPF